MQAYATPETGFSPQLRLLEPLRAPSVTNKADGTNAVLDLLVGQLAELVADRVAARLAAPAGKAKDEWLDTCRAAEYLGISRDSVRRLAADGSIQTEQAGVGCKLYFRRSDLDGWRCSDSTPVVPVRGGRHG